MKYREIAAKFQISVNTVDNHISKALRLIREGAQKVYAFYLTNIHKFCIVNLPAIPVINMKTKTKEYENPG